VAAELDLVIEGYGRRHEPEGKPKGTVHLGDCGFSEDLEPAPISPSDASSLAWRMLAGTSRGVWASRRGVGDGQIATLAEHEELVMAPFMMTGNTDTRRYWDLTDNIYRWRYFTDSESQGVSRVTESRGWRQRRCSGGQLRTRWRGQLHGERRRRREGGARVRCGVRRVWSIHASNPGAADWHGASCGSGHGNAKRSYRVAPSDGRSATRITTVTAEPAAACGATCHAVCHPHCGAAA
jgi:hypothetical protein